MSFIKIYQNFQFGAVAVVAAAIVTAEALVTTTAVLAGAVFLVVFPCARINKLNELFQCFRGRLGNNLQLGTIA